MTYDPEEKIWKGPTVPLHDVGDLNLGELILKTLSESPERVLQISSDDGKSLTCAELKTAAMRVSQNLAKIGMKPDDVLGIVAPQSHFATSVIVGCIISGVIVNPLHESLSDSDIASVYSQTRPKLIVAEPSFIPKLQRALRDVNFHYRIYSTASDSLFLRASNLAKPTGMESDFVAPRFLMPHSEKIFAVLCSSGTTGVPKGVSQAHLMMISSLPLIKLFSVSGETRSFCSSPLYWATGFFQNLLPIFSPHETRILPSTKPFAIEDYLELVQKYEITFSIITPAQLNALLNLDNISSYNLASLQRILSGGAIISKTIRDKFAATFPDKDLQIPYGMTESSATTSKPGEFKLEYSAGSIILPNNQIKIVDDDGNRLGVGEKGEICIKTPFKFQGYFNNPEATKNAVDDEGYFKSGDIGYFDEDGMLFVVDRKKDVLKVKSMQVNLSELENVVQAIEGVSLVSVVGIPDDVFNNLLAAGVVKRKGFESLSEQAIVDHVASIVPEFKQLQGGVFFFEALPMTPTGKIQRRLVLENILKVWKK